MRKTNIISGVLSTVLVTAFMIAPLNADSFGSSGGGSSGGSSGGSFGYASSGGGSSGGGGGGLFGGRTPIRNLLGRIHDRVHSHFQGGSSGGSSGGFSGSSSGGAYGSSGGFSGGSSGGSTGSYYAGGSSGGSYTNFNYSGSSAIGSGYYSGGSIGGTTVVTPSYSSYQPSYSSPIEYPGSTLPSMEYGTPIESYPNPGVVTPPEPTNAQPTEGAADKKDSSTLNTPASNGAETILTVRLPAESKFYVNDRATLSSGEEREFIARRLVFGKTYTFEVKAVLEKDGKTEERTEIVSIRGGDNREIAFDFSKPESLITSVEIQVPENAKVVLAGVPTKRMGLVRTFQTTELEKGQAWEDYTVVATIEKDGKTIEQTKTLTVVAGEAHKVEFDFDDNTTRFAVK